MTAVKRRSLEVASRRAVQDAKLAIRYLYDAIVELGIQEVQEVLVVPISFVSEHIETLYELDILYKKVAADAGISEYRRVPAFNCDPTFIRALREIVEEAMGSSQL